MEDVEEKRRALYKPKPIDQGLSRNRRSQDLVERQKTRRSEKVDQYRGRQMGKENETTEIKDF